MFEEDIGELLRYLPQYGIVICRKCRYAIQPHALDPHLLRHSIYRGDRQQLLGRLSSLKLHEPRSILNPPADIPAFPDLPVYDGHKCLSSGCTHACVSQKRMEQHWSRHHGEQNAKKVRSRPAMLQTFFKGNKLRYFEVAAEGSADTISPSSSIEPSEPHILEDPAPPLNLQDLAYFHHYCNSPFLVPQRSMAESPHFWNTELFELAFEYEFLMHGILGAAAAHLARQAQSPEACDKHYVAAVQYQAAGMPLFQKTKLQPNSRNGIALLVYTRFIGLQRIVLQHLEQDRIRSSVLCQRMPALETVLETFILFRGSEMVLRDLQCWLPSECGFGPGVEMPDQLLLSEIEDKLRTHAFMPSSLFGCTDMVARIISLPECLSEELSKSSPDDLRAIYRATAALLSVVSRSFSPDGRTLDKTGAVWNGMAVFALSVSDDFVKMLKSFHPAAMVLLAFWCALWSELEEHYPLLHGHSARLLRMIENGLDSDYACLVPHLGPRS